jgi:beta-lactamase regulating signal transducer with metallopeptidase domain
MLIHSLWQGLLLAVITAVVLMLTRRSSPFIRYNLVFAQLLLFAGACIFTFTWEWNSNELHRVMPTITGASFLTDMVKPFTERCISYFSANAPFILCTWFVFFIARSVKIMGGLVYVSRARYRNIYSPGEEWKQKIVLLCEQLQIKKVVTLFESAYVKVPLVLGHFKPVILIPAGLLTGLPASQIEAVLLHELAHIRRNDYFVNILQHITEAVFFFNPGLLWISSLLRDEREHCCDDIALGQTRNKREFIEALISFKEHATSDYVVAFPGRKDHLLRRVSRILYNKNNALSGAEKLCCMAGILILGVIISAAGIMEIQTIVHTKKIYVYTEIKTDSIVIKKTVAKVHHKRKPVIKHFEEVVPEHPVELTEADLQRAEADRDRIAADKDRVQADRDRVRAVLDREQAVKDRAQAMLDREQAMKDKIQADKDRQQAQKDREEAMRQRAALFN